MTEYRLFTFNVMLFVILAGSAVWAHARRVQLAYEVSRLQDRMKHLEDERMSLLLKLHSRRSPQYLFKQLNECKLPLIQPTGGRYVAPGQATPELATLKNTTASDPHEH